MEHQPPTRYNKASFIKSVPHAGLAPLDAGAEVAFAGRSNAGKSSALNTITGRKSLARTSKTPGRTQHLVFFALDETRRLVDLPGYGYAKVPLAIKKEWAKTLQEYLSTRTSLRGVILLMDIRHPMTDFDTQMLEWCRKADMPVHILLTKADKLKRGPAISALLQVEKQIKEFPLVSAQIFSATERTGAEEVVEVLDNWLGFTSE